MNSLRFTIMLRSATTTAISATMPTLAMIGTTADAMIAPGRISRLRRTRGVMGMCPISQNPDTRVSSVANVIARIAMSAPCGIASFIDERSDDAANDRADDDEPPAGHHIGHRERDKPCNRPADRAAHAAP